MLDFHFTVKAVTSCTLRTNKMERSGFKSGHAMRVSEPIKEDWPILLQ